MKRAMTSILVLLMVVTVGCASEKKSSKKSAPPYVEVPDGPYIPPGNGPGQGPGGSWQYGGTAAFTFDSTDVMDEYTGRVINTLPTNAKLNLNLLRYGSGYGGTVSIGYTDQGIQYEGFFTSGHSAKEVKYNVWFVKNNKMGYHGFFEDFIGAIVVVIDGVVDLGDGGGFEDEVSGSIYFKNFGLTYAPHPPTRCWFVSLGPYDCRAWPTEREVETTRALYPDNGYKRLGTFTGMSLKEAFNNQLSF